MLIKGYGNIGKAVIKIEDFENDVKRSLNAMNSSNCTFGFSSQTSVSIRLNREPQESGLFDEVGDPEVDCPDVAYKSEECREKDISSDINSFIKEFKKVSNKYADSPKKLWELNSERTKGYLTSNLENDFVGLILKNNKVTYSGFREISYRYTEVKTYCVRRLSWTFKTMGIHSTLGDIWKEVRFKNFGIVPKEILSDEYRAKHGYNEYYKSTLMSLSISCLDEGTALDIVSQFLKMDDVDLTDFLDRRLYVGKSGEYIARFWFIVRCD